MSSNYQQVKDFRQRQKENIIYVMGGRCSICGYDKCNIALELHHLNPKEKDFTISQNTNKAWETVIQELPKTILVCANCHREIHSGLIDNKQLISSFNPTKAEIIKQSKEKQQSFCKICGKPITLHAQYCANCVGQTRRNADRPKREELKQAIRTKPFTVIGKEYNVTDNAIRKWCKSMDLPTTKKLINSYSDTDWEKI